MGNSSYEKQENSGRICRKCSPYGVCAVLSILGHVEEPAEKRRFLEKYSKIEPEACLDPDGRVLMELPPLQIQGTTKGEHPEYMNGVFTALHAYYAIHGFPSQRALELEDLPEEVQEIILKFGMAGEIRSLLQYLRASFKIR